MQPVNTGKNIKKYNKRYTEIKKNMSKCKMRTHDIYIVHNQEKFNIYVYLMLFKIITGIKMVKAIKKKHDKIKNI